jgi:hypothetical protein
MKYEEARAMKALRSWLNENGFAVVAHAETAEGTVYLQLENGRGALIDVVLGAADLRSDAENAVSAIQGLVEALQPVKLSARL